MRFLKLVITGELIAKYIPIMKIKGAGNSNNVRNYIAIDNNPSDGTNYYRLKQTDFDGNYSYSEIKMVVYDAERPVLIYPNPAGDELSVQIFSQDLLLVLIQSQFMMLTVALLLSKVQ